MPISHKNCYEVTYFLHIGITKTGKPRYFMSKIAEGNLAESIPDGYEIFERPGGLVVIRKIPKTPILPHELKYVQDIIATIGNKVENEWAALYQRLGASVPVFGLERMPLREYWQSRYEAEIRGKEIIVYEVRGGRVTPMLKFRLINENTRKYCASYWYIGRTDGWRSLHSRGELRDLADEHCPSLGRDDFYDREGW